MAARKETKASPELTQLQSSKVFTAVVVSSSVGSRAVTIMRDGYGMTTGGELGYMMQGIVVTSVLSHFLGFKDCSVPQPGTRVVCVTESASHTYVIGTIPQESLGLQDMPARVSLGAKNALADTANRIGHTNTSSIYDNRRPTDIVDGEYVIANELGVLLGLYQEMAHLKASELAQVQCYLFDDLVRIISHNFQHYTALGEYNVYHDGKQIMAEFGATHKPGESYGRPAVESAGEEPIFEKEKDKKKQHTVDDEKDFYKFKDDVDERVKAIERFKMFLGGLGDFLRIMLVRPDPDEVRINDPEKEVKKPDTGLFDFHVGTDGGAHLRSVKEIFLEKTNWIRVPLRKAAPDDPKGDDAKELSYDKKDKFEFKDNFTYKGNPFAYALQLRDYVAYVNEKQGYRNFKKHEKDFYVNDKIDEENKISEFGQVDEQTSLDLQSYQLRTAGVYLMPNGGITIRDAWNSAIVMEGGNIYIQPAKDLVTQPLRNNIVKAGGHINMACKKNIDLSSTEEGVRVKSEKTQYFYSDAGGFVVEANSSQDTPGTPDPEKEAIEYIGGIVLKSKLGIYSYAKKDIVGYAKKNILFQSLENTDIISKQNCYILSSQATFMLADTALVMHATQVAELISDSTVILAGSSTTAIGQKDQMLAIKYSEDNPFVDPLAGVIEVSTLTSQFQELKEAKDNILKQTTFQNEDKFESLKFRFLETYKYEVNASEDAIPSTMAQQDDKLTSLYGLSEWAEKKINDTYPYPGADLFENFYISADAPVNLESNSLGQDYSNKADSDKTPASIQLDSLLSYKIQ
jgi:hypothetical protein